jgi:carboxylesterase
MIGAEPLFLKGSRRSCLLLHGAGGGTTWDLKEFARILHAKTKMTVWLPALTGFGTTPEDLYNITFDDWRRDTHDGVDRLHKDCDEVFAVGHSMGGLLAMLLASERRDVKGIVTWAAPFGVRTRLLRLLPIIHRTPLVRRLVPDRVPNPMPPYVIQQGWVGYDWIPVQLGLAVHEGMKRFKKAPKSVHCPALIVQGSRDQVVAADAARRLYDAIASVNKQLWIIPGANHLLMNDAKRKNKLFARTLAFLESI